VKVSYHPSRAAQYGRQFSSARDNTKAKYMNEKICLVTGANSGIGKVTAKALAAGGATVIMVCRNRDKGEAAREEIARETRGENIDLMIADFSDLNQVRKLAADVKAKYPRLHTLVNNAGTFYGKMTMTANGYESTFAVNHLGYFLLTVELLDLLKSSAPARVVNVASNAHNRAHIDFDNLNIENGYSGWKAYAKSKLANVLFTYELARRLEGTGVTANCLHPGVVGTNLFNHIGGLGGKIVRLFAPFMRTPENGADTIIWLASSPEVEGITGKYFVDRIARATNPESYDTAVAARLWEVSERMCSSI
jgi:retinol dehydrogenase 14